MFFQLRISLATKQKTWENDRKCHKMAKHVFFCQLLAPYMGQAALFSVQMQFEAIEDTAN